MDLQQIAVRLTFNELRLPLTIQSFEDRLIAQKTICLSQAAGVQLGYHFNWYLRGPYAPALTKDLYAIDQDETPEDTLAHEWCLDAASKARLAQARALFMAPDRPALASRLELLASTWYLIANRRVSADDIVEIRRVLELFGKSFSELDVRQAVMDLRKHELIPRSRQN